MTSPMPLEESFEDWRDDALDLLARVAKDGEPIDAYALQEKHGLRQPPNPGSHWGILFNMAGQRGLIVKESYGASKRPSRSGGACYSWRGLPTNERTSK